VFSCKDEISLKYLMLYVVQEFTRCNTWSVQERTWLFPTQWLCPKILHTRNMLDKWCSTQLILLITILKGGWKVSDFLTNASCTGNSIKNTRVHSIWSHLVLYICGIAEMHTNIGTLRIKYMEILKYEKFPHAQYWYFPFWNPSPQATKIQNTSLPESLRQVIHA
jgi:hypothetical protein